MGRGNVCYTYDMQAIPQDILEKLEKLPQEEGEVLLRAGFYEAVRAGIQQLERDIEQAQRHVLNFESKYGMDFEAFETTLLPKLDSLEAHEDYNDWFFWLSVWTEKRRHLENLKNLLAT